VLLDDDTDILVHKMVLAELLLGGLKKDSAEVEALLTQEHATEVTGVEVIHFITEKNITNKGVGYVDCCLMASCLLDDAAILTFDNKLKCLAEEFAVPVIR
jgi:predicted nucleic acid-binding protein